MHICFVSIPIREKEGSDAGKLEMLSHFEIEYDSVHDTQLK